MHALEQVFGALLMLVVLVDVFLTVLYVPRALWVRDVVDAALCGRQ